MNEISHLSHCTYLVQYHLVWCSRFRYDVLENDVEASLKEILREVCERYKYEILELETMPDYVHIFVSVKPTVAPTDVVRALKSISAIKLFERFPALGKFYSRCGSLWSKGYFVGTVGYVGAETIRKYIREQKSKDKRGEDGC